MSLAEVHEVEVLEEHLPSGLWREAWRRLRRNPVAIIGASFVAVFVLVALFAPLLAPYPPNEQNLGLLANGCCPGPSWAHPMGVDELGRDELSRVMYGARYSLVIGVVSVAVGLSLGMLLGAVAGGFGGFTDSVAMRGMDIMLAIPGFLLALGIVTLMGPGLVPGDDRRRASRTSRSSRGCSAGRSSVSATATTPSPRARSACDGGRSSPGTSSRTPSRPSSWPARWRWRRRSSTWRGSASSGSALRILRRPEWGTMLTNANLYVSTAPFLALFPGLAIVMIVLGFNLIGDGLREALDPKLRGRV